HLSAPRNHSQATIAEKKALVGSEGPGATRPSCATDYFTHLFAYIWCRPSASVFISFYALVHSGSFLLRSISSVSILHFASNRFTKQCSPPWWIKTEMW